jgi:hypothetical protein
MHGETDSRLDEKFYQGNHEGATEVLRRQSPYMLSLHETSMRGFGCL